ncbi:heat stress transcription factor A-5 [Tanacetum coccineum]
MEGRPGWSHTPTILFAAGLRAKTRHRAGEIKWTGQAEKPVHSHGTPQTSTVDPERAAFEEEIDKLTRKKTSHENSLLRYKQKHPASKLQLEDLTQRQNPEFVEHLAQKLESMDFSADNKKRRLPKSQVFPDDGVVDPTRPDFGNVSHHEFPGKLRLELSPDTCKSFSFNMFLIMTLAGC